MLSFLILFPFVSVLALAILPERKSSCVALALSGFYFLSSLSLFYLFDPNQTTVQLSEKISWFPTLGIHYFVGIDGISFWLVILTTFIFPLSVWSSTLSVKQHLKGFLICLFALVGFVMGSFLAFDAILFYIFFEGSLIPLFFLILIWGGKEKIYAAFKFFIYTALGSLFMLIGILTLILITREQMGIWSASLLDFYSLKIPFVGNTLLSTQSLLFFSFFIAFAIKTPLFPFHTWLPLAHVQAPTAGSVFLAAIVLKMGAYGFLRLILPLFPQAVMYYSPWVCFLAVVSIVYGALMALAQSDMKKLIAYSSVSHMGYTLLGFFVFNNYAFSGGFLQMLAHGLSSAALFLLVGMLYERTNAKNIYEYGGIASVIPVYSVLFFIVSLSTIALPLTAGFVAEFLVLMGTFLSRPIWFPFALIGVILGASYMLFLILKVFFGPTNKFTSIADLRIQERLIIIPFIILIFVMGIAPRWFFHYSEKSLNLLFQNSSHYQLMLNTNEEKIFLPFKKD